VQVWFYRQFSIRLSRAAANADGRAMPHRSFQGLDQSDQGKMTKLMSFSAKRWAYCLRPSFSSQSVTCCIAAALRVLQLYALERARPSSRGLIILKLLFSARWRSLGATAMQRLGKYQAICGALPSRSTTDPGSK